MKDLVDFRTHTRYDSTVLVWHHQHLCDARELGKARPVRACPTGPHHASAVALHAEAVRAVGGVGVGGDIAERKTVSKNLNPSLPPGSTTHSTRVLYGTLEAETPHPRLAVTGS